MSQEQAKVYKKFKDADDAMGNLGWASKLSKKALRQAQEAPPELERLFSLGDDEKIIWRLMKLPRKYTDLENTGLLPADKVRGILRGLVSADMVDIVEQTEAKPILPMEIGRLKRALAGQDEKVEVKKKSFEERVYRPSIGLASENAEATSSEPPATAARASSAPVERAAPAKPDAPKRLSLDDQKLKERIEKDHKERMGASHYAVLGVPQTATPADIKKAFVTLAREWHPDSLSGTALVDDEGIKGKLADLFSRLQDANGVLSDQDARAVYDKSGAGAVSSGTGKKVRRTAEADVASKKAEVFFKKKEWRSAEVHYRLAGDLDEEDPRHKVGLAWAIFHNETKDKAVRTAEAKKLLGDVLKSARIADAAYKLGLIARQEGNEVEADKRMDEAYKLDPKNPEIQRERRLKEMRATKAKEDAKNEASLFGRFKKAIKD